MNTGRAFLPMVCTTVGAVGPRPFLSFVRRAFDAAIAREILDGGRGCLARYRSTLFFASLHAALARATSAMMRDRLFRSATADPRASTVRAADPAPNPPARDSAAAAAREDDSGGSDSDPDETEPGRISGAVGDVSPGSDSDADA